MDWIDINKDKKHIAREREKAKKLRKSQWWLNLLQKGVCHYCQKKYTPEELTMDHVIPVSRGGFSKKGNIVPCCKSCNNEKKYFTPVEILMKKLDKDKK